MTDGLPELPGTERRRGKQQGRSDYKPTQKARVLSILDFFDGNLSRTSQATGVSKTQISKWRKDLELDSYATVRAQRRDDVNDTLPSLKKLVESLCVIVLMKAHGASMRELYITMGIVLDKIENLSKVLLVESAQRNLQALPTQAPAQLPAPSGEDAARLRWERVVDQVIAQATAQGRDLTRDEAIAGIIEANPEAREYLVPVEYSKEFSN